MSIVDQAGNALVTPFTGQTYTVNPVVAGTFNANPSINTTGRLALPMFAPIGEVPAGNGIRVGSFTTQTEVLNTWVDGSARHMMLYLNATSTGAQVCNTITLANGTPFVPSWPTVSVSFAGNTANLGSWDGTNVLASGAVAMRAWRLISLGSLLQVLFDITSYAAGGHRISITIQNVKNTSSMNSVTGNLVTTINGVNFARMTVSGFKIWTGQVVQGITYSGISSEANITPDFGPWQRANVIPKFGGSSNRTYDINGTSNPAYSLGGGTYTGVPFQWSFGEATANAADSENAGRQELNPWTDWEQRYFFYGNDTYLQVVLANACQYGLWTANVSKDSTGSSILRVDQDGNDANICTDYAAASGLAWPNDVNTVWTGALAGNGPPNYPSNVINYNREHVSDMITVAYWLTGDQGFLWKLRWAASFTIFQSYIPTTEQDPDVWPGWLVGRLGTLGLLNDAEWGRSFGRPLKLVLRAAFSMPDAYSTDRTYFKTIGQNNLTRIGQYIDYIDAKSWNSAWAHFVGIQPIPAGISAAYTRFNTITSSAGNVLTVIGDNSGVGTATNDHSMATGDFVVISGTPNGMDGRRAITRLSAITFSIAGSFSGSAAGGTWSCARGGKFSPWRISVTTREVAWAGFTNFFTMTNSIWAFAERHVQTAIAVQDYPNIDTSPGIAYNYYPTPLIPQANTYRFALSWADYFSFNTNSSNSAEFMNSQNNYTLFASATHRGNIEGWNDNNPNEYYTIYATTILAQGVQRGVPGALAAYNRLVAASGVLGELNNRVGFFLIGS